ncbi:MULTISPECIES: sporulation protein YjcZ [unclassified Paenibacillus]|nr:MULTISPECIES: sporulation protein YjcZ [unclassified Paenibacillus]
MGYPAEVATAGYGGSSAAAILVLFVLLVIITMTFVW